MILKNKDGTISFSLFSHFPELICFMSTRSNGNLWIKDTNFGDVKPFLIKQGIRLNQFIVSEQCHGSKVAEVKDKKSGPIIGDVDGLITGLKELYLGVNSADCVPLFFYSPDKGLIGIIHAGWKGTLENISGKTVKLFEDSGSNPESIRVAFGPHIGGCCYNVEPDRVSLFNKIIHDEKIVYKDLDKWHIDLGLANKLQLIKAGIEPTHIDAPITCTSCQNDIYFSFRKDGIESYGEMLGVIGITN